MSEFFYFDEFQRHKESGFEAQNRGDIKGAKYHFLMAAEYLFKLALNSKGRLKNIRYEQACKFMDLAQSLKTPAKVASEEKGGGDGEKSANPTEWMIREKPSVKFDDIAGLVDVKEQIRIKMIYPFSRPDLAEKYGVKKGGGILLYGPPGTGKTMLGKAVAAELDAPFFLIKPSDIMSKWVGESEKNIKMLFDETRKTDRAIIFIDEVEALVPSRRDQESNVMRRVVPQILAEMDGFEKRANALLFVGATNEPWEIDPAMMRPGRLDEKIYVGLPDAQARRQIFELNLKGAPIDTAVSTDDLTARTDGYSGADIAYVCRKVRETVFQLAVEKGQERLICLEDFAAIFAKIGPSVMKDDLAMFEKFRKEISGA